MNLLKPLAPLILAGALAACQTLPAPTEQAPEDATAQSQATQPPHLKAWEEGKPALLEALRSDPHLRVLEQEDGSLYIQIRSAHAYTTGRIAPTGELASALAHIAASLKGRPYLSVVIEGHSDNIGNPAKNQQLSEQRAKAALDYLQAQGVEQAMEHQGLGADKPIASNNTREGRAVNRRVDIRIQPSTAPTAQPPSQPEAAEPNSAHPQSPTAADTTDSPAQPESAQPKPATAA